MADGKMIYELDYVDAALKAALPAYMTNGTETMLTIRMICGFELFNTRPYHNLENWSRGYVIEDERNEIKVSAEDLDVAVNRYLEARGIEKPWIPPGPVRSCRSCKGRIVWTETENGRKMPVNAYPDPNGNIYVERRGKHLVAVVGEVHNSGPRYTSHFATCPHADEHRKGS